MPEGSEERKQIALANALRVAGDELDRLLLRIPSVTNAEYRAQVRKARQDWETAKGAT